MVKARSDAANSAPTPTATMKSWQMIPACSPAMVQMPWRYPYLSPEAMEQMAPGPGENEMAQAAAKNANQVEKAIASAPWVQSALCSSAAGRSVPDVRTSRRAAGAEPFGRLGRAPPGQE